MDIDALETEEGMAARMAAALESKDERKISREKKLQEAIRTRQEYERQADALTDPEALEKLKYEKQRKLEKDGLVPGETAEGLMEARQAALDSLDDDIITRELIREQSILMKLKHESRKKALEAVLDKVTGPAEFEQKKEKQMKDDVKYQIFVSSTYEDLKEERESIIWEILKSENIPVGMENFSASNDRPWSTIQKTIDNSDIYILLLAGRYGSIDEETKLSWTEKEYNYAKEKGLPIIAFIRNDDYITATKLDKGNKKKKLDLFKINLRGGKGHTTEYWNNKDDLATMVIQALNKQIKTFEDDLEDSHGWHRDIPSSSKNSNPSSVDKPLSQKQQDMIAFLERFIKIRNDEDSVDDFIKEIGRFRFDNILPMIKELKIIDILPNSNGEYRIRVLQNYKVYQEKDIQDIIESVRAGEIKV